MKLNPRIIQLLERHRKDLKVKAGQELGKIGFSGTATTYSHLHYQLMDGKDFLNDNALPCKFSDFKLIEGDRQVQVDAGAIDTGDILISE